MHFLTFAHKQVYALPKKILILDVISMLISNKFVNIFKFFFFSWIFNYFSIVQRNKNTPSKAIKVVTQKSFNFIYKKKGKVFCLYSLQLIKKKKKNKSLQLYKKNLIITIINNFCCKVGRAAVGFISLDKKKKY